MATSRVETPAVHRSSLHGVGRVGAQHQHLAVRHVDDAQQTERDRQAQRREQEHAGQRQAVEQVADDADQALVRHDGVARVRRRGAHARVGLARRAVVAGASICCSVERKSSLALLAMTARAPPAARRHSGWQIDARDRPAPAPRAPWGRVRRRAPGAAAPPPRRSRPWPAPRRPPAGPRCRESRAGAAPAPAAPRAGYRCSPRPPCAAGARVHRPARSSGSRRSCVLRIPEVGVAVRPLAAGDRPSARRAPGSPAGRRARPAWSRSR